MATHFEGGTELCSVTSAGRFRESGGDGGGGGGGGDGQDDCDGDAAAEGAGGGVPRLMHEAVWHGDACVGSALALDQQEI